MQSSSSGDVDLLFVALHQASLQCSQKSFMRYQMSRGLYFYDQITRVSHIGGIHRYKRHPEELNQALHQVRVALAAEDDDPAKTETVTTATTFYPTPSPVKQQLGKQPSDGLLKKIQRKLNAPVVPEVLFKELDLLFQRFDDKAKSSSTPKVPSSIPPKSDQLDLPDTEPETDAVPIQEANDEDELVSTTTTVVPKISLPGSLIIALHSTWTDLIANTEYKTKTWRTKAGEDAWNRLVEKKRLEQINAEKQRSIAGSKAGRLQMRSNRSLSRVSFLSMSNMSQADNTKLNKPMHQGSSESLSESVKSSENRVEFKLSAQTDDNKQQTANKQKGVLFDVPKPDVDVHEDVIALTQAKCKRILAEMKQKIISTTGEWNVQNPKMCKVWFYGENQHIRNKTNLLSLNELAKKKRSNFVMPLLRGKLPGPYEIGIEIPENKHICYIELTDGSIQVYYPSGRLAVLRLPSSNSTTLFFDDIETPENQFLGLVTSAGSVLVMQPTLHARFVTDILHERGYLCNSKTGLIDKQFQWHLNTSGTQSVLSNPTASNDEDDILPPLLETTVQLQLNSSMQLEFFNPTNIRFAYAGHKEEFKFQLGSNLPSQSPTIFEPTISSIKKNSGEKKVTSKSKLSAIISTSTIPNDLLNIPEKQQIQVERLLDGQVNVRELPMLRELITLRKRIRNICNNWLKECRMTLGVMDIDSYCLPDWPSGASQLTAPIRKFQPSKSAKSRRHVSISSKRDSSASEFLQPSEREQIIRTHSARKPEPNVISNTIMQFVPRSDSGRAMKQKLFAKKKLSPLTLPMIRVPSAPVTTEESLSARIIIPLDLPFACPILIRQRFIQDGPISTILYDTCTCRTDHVSLIHDLEFDTFIQLSKHLNPQQLVVIGIINSNLRQIENEQVEQSNELYEILQTLHYHLNYGRSQISLCRLSTNDDYRCLIYDLAEATKQSSLYGPLLVRRHHVEPGFVLIYQHGQLIFGDYIFNGYGRNVQDLKKQLNRMRHQQVQQIALPEEFKFISDNRRTNATVLKSV